MTAPEPREGIMELRPYKAGDAVLEGFAEPIRLASNEGALGPSPKAMAALEAGFHVVCDKPVTYTLA